MTTATITKIEVGMKLRNGRHTFRVVETATRSGVEMVCLQWLRIDGTDSKRRPMWVGLAHWLRAIESGTAEVL